MRKIEEIVEHFLLVLLIWESIEIVYSLFNCLEESPTMFFPWRVSQNWTILGLFLSALAGTFFPTWNVGKYFRINNLKEISDYKIAYKINYFLLMVGYFGLLFIDWGNTIFLILGIICLIASYSTLFSLAISQRRPSVH